MPELILAVVTTWLATCAVIVVAGLLLYALWLGMAELAGRARFRWRCWRADRKRDVRDKDVPQRRVAPNHPSHGPRLNEAAFQAAANDLITEAIRACRAEASGQTRA